MIAAIGTADEAATTPEAAPHCFRPPSPLDRMINAATGRHSATVRRSITLECPSCRRRRSVPMMWHDLPGTQRVVAACTLPACQDGAEVRYFDAAGKELHMSEIP